MNENQIATRVVGLAIDVHNALGPGLLEKTYEECLFYKIAKSGLRAE
jgi:GxxExxY protein